MMMISSHASSVGAPCCRNTTYSKQGGQSTKEQRVLMVFCVFPLPAAASCLFGAWTKLL